MNKLLLLLTSFCSPLAFTSEIALDQYLIKVKEQNLNLKLEFAKQNASEVKAVGVRLPPPMFIFIQAKEKGGNSPSGFEFNQEVPFPTKMMANRSSRIYEARAQKEMYSAYQNEYLAKAKFAYVDLWLIQERIKIVEERKKILEDHLKLLRSAVRSDSFLKIHLLKSESDLDLLENELESTIQNKKEKQLILAEMINEDHKDFNPVAIEPPMSPIPILRGENIPQLESLRLSLEGKKERELESGSSWLPDFNLKYKQMGATSMSDKYREVMIGITLPFIYFWQPKADAQTASIETSNAELKLNRVKRNIDTQVASLYSRIESLQKQLLNLKNKLIPRAYQRMKIVRNLAPRDMETIQDHRATMEAHPELKITELELRMQYEESIAELEKYVTNKGQTHE